MTKQTTKILAILFAFFSFSAIRESSIILTSKDGKNIQFNNISFNIRIYMDCNLF